MRWLNYRLPYQKFKSGWTEHAQKLLPPGEGYQRYDGILGDLSIELDLSVYSHRLIYLNYYELTTIKLIERILRAGDTFVDAGANVGLMTLLGAREVGPTGKVVAFEPNEHLAGRVRNNITANKFDNVTLIEKGCSDTVGQAQLYEFEGEAFGTLSMSKLPGKTVQEVTEIELTRIVEHVEPPVRLMKLDIEGAEFAALRGAESLFTSNQPPHLIIEINHETSELMGYNPIEMIDWLLKRVPGYRMSLIRSRRLQTLSRDELAKRLENGSVGTRNLWMAPAN